MSTVVTWFQTLFETPEAILCVFYFAIRLVYWLCTIPKRKSEKLTATEQANEVKDIYVATAQLYELIRKERENERTQKP